MRWRQWGMGLVVAGPVVFFPFSRGYYLFYVLLLGFGLARSRLPALWREWQGVRLAMLATIVPMVVTIAALGLTTGHVEKEWLEKVVIALVAGIMGLAAASLARDRQNADLAAWLIVAAILSWMLDGLQQLATGYSISGQPMVGRLTSYFSHPYKFGFFVSFMALLPAFHFYRRRNGAWLAAGIMAAAGLVVASAGSRFGLLGWLTGLGVLVLCMIRPLPLRLRLAICVGLPLLLAALLAGLYSSNQAFSSRVDQTALALKGMDYQAWNNATSKRLDIWYPAVELAKDNWLLGVGPGQVTEAIKPYLGPDNIYRVKDIKIFHTHQVTLEIWLGAGLLGVAAFLTFYGWLCAWLWRHRARPDLGWACLLVWALVWLPFGTQLDWYASEMVLWSFFMLGLGFGLHAAASAGDAAVAPGAPGAAASPEGRVIV